MRDEIARTPLLDAETEVELSKTIEAGLFAAQLIEEGRVGRRKVAAPSPRAITVANATTPMSAARPPSVRLRRVTRSSAS